MSEQSPEVVSEPPDVWPQDPEAPEPSEAE
jgi:hypothetical protein